ncbi:MAG TPA: cytochrome c oxidase subunit 3 [Verrucomicrobiae bacterium]|jgi:cytochrome c oxidase subunit 3|nr:cytochrome c oxidase subunit 3 [Verrucomicrobiae bacterium]
MADAHPTLAEQFDDLPQQRNAALLGMWTFLATEVLFFGGLFLSYTIYRHAYYEAFEEAGRHVKILYGSINTALLLTSSLTMSLAIHSAQVGQQRLLVRFLRLTIFLGICFLVVKGMEYKSDIDEHFVPGARFEHGLPAQAQIFWFLYWIMTGVHSLHLLVGIGLLVVITWMARKGRFSEHYNNPVVISGLYWHFVDVIWVWLYALFYLVNRN